MIIVMTANSVHGQAENQTPVAAFGSREDAIAYYEASKLPGWPEREQVDRYWLAFREESVLRWYNGSSIGDWHPPQSDDGFWAVNPCIFDIQLHQFNGTVLDLANRGIFVPLDPIVTVSQDSVSEAT